MPSTIIISPFVFSLTIHFTPYVNIMFYIIKIIINRSAHIPARPDTTMQEKKRETGAGQTNIVFAYLVIKIIFNSYLDLGLPIDSF
jgi:hypothetical protein